MVIKDIKLINFDKYLDGLRDGDPRNDVKVYTKLDSVLENIAICCTVESLTAIEFAFLKEMSSSAILTEITTNSMNDVSNSFNQAAKKISDLSEVISNDSDCIKTEFGLLPLFMNSFNGFFRFSGSTINSITRGRITKYMRTVKSTDELEKLIRNDLLIGLDDTVKSYYSDIDPMSESIMHYKFYSTTSPVTLLNLKSSTGIFNFFNASDSDKVLGMSGINDLLNSGISTTSMIDDIVISFIIQGPASSFGLFAAYTNSVSLKHVDSLRLSMNGRNLLYPTNLLNKYIHRIEDSIVAYLNERDNYIKDKKFSISDILATLPSNAILRYMVSMNIRDAFGLMGTLESQGITGDDHGEMAYYQFYNICKDISDKASLIINKFFH